MEEWKQYRLIDILDKLIDYRGKTPKKTTSGIPLITAKIIKNGRIDTPTEFISVDDYDSWMVRGFPKVGDVVLTTEAPLGEVAQLDNENIALAQRVVTLRGKAGVLDNTYLKYYLMSNVGQQRIKARETGTTVTGIKQSELREVLVDCPPYQFQQKIASILKSIDDKIEVNRRINDNLEQQAQELFKSWFVDFEPFKDGEFVESELGMIPKGWRVYSMDELVDIIGGYSYKSNELQDSTTAMATIKNFERSGGFKINGFKEIVPSLKAKQEQFLKKFDIIIAHTDITQNADIIGNPALILNFGKYERLIMSMDLVKVKSKSDYITYGLLYSFFADARFKGHALGYVNGTTVLHLSKKAIPEYKLALPHDLSILAEYGKTFDSLFAKEAKMMEETDRLTELRDTLLPKLMSGEIKVINSDLISEMLEKGIR